VAYNINHRKHVVDYLNQFTVGTPNQIVKALPKAKRTPTSYSTVSQAINRFVDEGIVRRVGPGLYALATSDATPVDALCRKDEVFCAILGFLETPSLTSTATSSKAILNALEDKGFARPRVQAKLLKLLKLGVITKSKYFGTGRYYSIKKEAFEPAEWRETLEGVGFRTPRTIAAKPRAPKMPHSKGIAGESVPAFNILRRRKHKPDPILTKPPATPQPEQLTVPTPGRESSIFD
jgi:hypothetical protein